MPSLGPPIRPSSASACSWSRRRNCRTVPLNRIWLGDKRLIRGSLRSLSFPVGGIGGHRQHSNQNETTSYRDPQPLARPNTPTRSPSNSARPAALALVRSTRPAPARLAQQRPPTVFLIEVSVECSHHAPNAAVRPVGAILYATGVFVPLNLACPFCVLSGQPFAILWQHTVTGTVQRPDGPAQRASAFDELVVIGISPRPFLA